MSAMFINFIVQNIYNLNDLRWKNKLRENTRDIYNIVIYN